MVNGACRKGDRCNMHCMQVGLYDDAANIPSAMYSDGDR